MCYINRWNLIVVIISYHHLISYHHPRSYYQLRSCCYSRWRFFWILLLLYIHQFSPPWIFVLLNYEWSQSGSFFFFFLHLQGFGGNVWRFIPHLCFFFSFFLSGDRLMHTNSTLCARISPKWLSEMRRPWPNIPWQVACELFSRGLTFAW